MKLVIVESPTKAKTLKRFLGSEYSVLSSFGHIRDLPKSSMGVNIEKNFEPKYTIPPKARKAVNALVSAAKNAEEIILASDEDREGEAIAWHLLSVLGLNSQKKKKKNAPSVKRIVFHEITKKAILNAMEHPRDVDMRLVNAQQGRRVLDRLVGYELSPFLWKKIRRGLSAGRVQSVALRFIVEREKERKQFVSETFYRVEVLLKKPEETKIFSSELIRLDEKPLEVKEKHILFSGPYTVSKTILSDKKSVDAVVLDLEKAAFSVDRIEKRSIKRSPFPPFTTSSLQQSAINTFGFSARQTMIVAQKLYEEGHITYMRTDSVNLSSESIAEARKYIQKTFGKLYLPEKPRIYTTKSKGAQEAHEAIRPARPDISPEKLLSKLTEEESKLYRLIWNRMIASQMSDAELFSTRILIDAKGKKHTAVFLTQGSRILFDGHFILGKSSQKIENELPDIAEGQNLLCVEIHSLEKSTEAPPRYTEASLVKILEDRGIGRPSTYAPTVSTLFTRNYIDRDDAKRLYPEEIGTIVSDLLAKHFASIVDDGFTAKLENDLDEIAEGKQEWQPVIEKFYVPFHENLEKKKEEIQKNDLLEPVGKKCPKCGKDLVNRYGRFGKFVSCSGYPDCVYIEKSDDEKKLQQQFANELCPECRSPLIVKHGRFGSFLGCSKYPECKTIKKIEKNIGMHCPNCKEGQIIEKKSKRGKIFFGCNQYPKCKTAFWSKPTGEKCPQCGQGMVFAPKGETQCSNKECPTMQKKQSQKTTSPN